MKSPFLLAPFFLSRPLPNSPPNFPKARQSSDRVLRLFFSQFYHLLNFLIFRRNLNAQISRITIISGWMITKTQIFNASYDIPSNLATSTSKTTQYRNIASIQSMPEPPIVLSALKYSLFAPSWTAPVHAIPRAKPIAITVIRQSVTVSFLIEMSLVDSDSLCRGNILPWETECPIYVLIMSEQVSDQTRKQIFKNTFRRKIDLRRMTSVCSGDRELARSLVVSALREIADDIENGEVRHPPPQNYKPKSNL